MKNGWTWLGLLIPAVFLLSWMGWVVSRPLDPGRITIPLSALTVFSLIFFFQSRFPLVLRRPFLRTIWLVVSALFLLDLDIHQPASNIGYSIARSLLLILVSFILATVLSWRLPAMTCPPISTPPPSSFPRSAAPHHFSQTHTYQVRTSPKNLIALLCLCFLLPLVAFASWGLFFGLTFLAIDSILLLSRLTIDLTADAITVRLPVPFLNPPEIFPLSWCAGAQPRRYHWTDGGGVGLRYFDRTIALAPRSGDSVSFSTTDMTFLFVVPDGAHRIIAENINSRLDEIRTRSEKL